MHRTTRRILLALLLAFLAYMAVFTVAMVSQLADAADRIHAGAGQWTFVGLLGLLAAAVLLPTFWLLRLPPALKPPTGNDAAAQAAYQTRLRQHLARNPHLADQPLDSEADMAQALQRLQALAEAETRSLATTVLTSTALLQNGKLDAVVVLATQMRLVWRVARIYGLRPSLRQLGYLYGNVGACMLVASSMDAIDFAELAAPLVQATTPAALAGVPGLGAVGNLLTNSLASGAANAFLTLRVGLVAQAYCAPLLQPERASVRHSATVRAAGQLGQLVREVGGRVSQAVYGRIRDAVSHTAQSTVNSVRQAGQGVASATKDAARSAASTSGAWVDQATDKLQQATLQVADHTARAVDAVQRGTQATVKSLKKKP
ncbi:MAG: YcjF family protein [Acidovorax sp.]|jgi:signal transduction histidine kinase|nr:YcjF family protein [Acidovorax sp.]